MLQPFVCLWWLMTPAVALPCLCVGGVICDRQGAKPVPDPHCRVLLSQEHVAEVGKLTVATSHSGHTPCTETRYIATGVGPCVSACDASPARGVTNCPTSRQSVLLYAIGCPRHPSVASPLCAALALVVPAQRVLHVDGPGWHGTCLPSLRGEGEGGKERERGGELR